MNKEARVYRFDHRSLQCAAVGNHAIWAGTLWHLAQRDGFEPFVVPPDPDDCLNVKAIWNYVFPGRVNVRPERAAALTIAPDEESKRLGLLQPTIFDNAAVEMGNELAPGEAVGFPLLWNCSPHAKRVMIAPVEFTQGNGYFDENYWLQTAADLKAAGYAISLFGASRSPRDTDGHVERLLGKLVCTGQIDRTFPATVEAFADCVAECSLLVCSSTGPAWLGLFTDIEQICLESPRHAELAWKFGANLKRIAKSIAIVQGKRHLFGEPRRVAVRFPHGLGDSANFVRIAKTYEAAGCELAVQVTEDKRWLFEAAGVKLVDRGAHHSWPEAFIGTRWNLEHDRSQDWAGNKVGCNLEHAPLPPIFDSREAAWTALVANPVDLREKLDVQTVENTRSALAPFPKPWICFHGMGNTDPGRKNVSQEFHFEFYGDVVHRTGGTIIVLDWDNRSPRVASRHVIHASDLFGHVSIQQLLILASLCDIVVGVDSGPLHAAQLVRAKRVGLFREGHYATTYAIPDPELLCVTIGRRRDWNLQKRIGWQIVEAGDDDLDSYRCSELVARMLGPAKYLVDAPIAADVQLQQFVAWTRNDHGGWLSKLVDRDVSFDLVFRETLRRFESPTFVETGCIRASEDWGGAGYSTYLFGAFLSRLGGRLHSVDLNDGNCRFAHDRTRCFGETVAVHVSRGDDWLRANNETIHVLYLDSLDTTEPNHQENCLIELQAALPQLHSAGIVIIDDSPFDGRQWTGKGGQAIPWALANGFEMLHDGYQVVLSRKAELDG